MGFNSKNFVFRQTVMGDAFSRLGITSVPMVREPLLEGLLRERSDNKNIRPSKHQVIEPVYGNLKEKVNG